MADQSNVLVDECPPPPIYYRVQNLTPPVITSGAIDTLSQYGASIEIPGKELKLDNTSSDCNIEETLLRKLEDIYKNIQSLHTEFPSYINTGEKITTLRTSIQNFHESIVAYRPHEARENLCHELSQQNEQLKQLRDNMKSLLINQ